MSELKQLTEEQWATLLRDQNVPREHLAFKCPMCGSIQSATDLIRAGAGEDFKAVSGHINYSCVGRWTKAGPPKSGNGPCNWTLGGLFQTHTMEVVTAGGNIPTFEPCTPQEAQDHMKQQPQEKIDV